MRNKFNSMADCLEPFLLGMSCLVGWDSFSLLLSHTKVSGENYYIMFGSIVIVSILCCAMDTHYIFDPFNPSAFLIFIIFIFLANAIGLIFSSMMTMIFFITFLFKPRTGMVFHLSHLYYCLISGILVVFVYKRILSRIFIVSIVMGIGYIMSFLIIHSCSYYSTSRTNILTFILGIFASRFLPSLLWILSNVKDDYERKVNQIAKALVLSRFIFCFISILLKLYTGKLTYKPSWMINNAMSNSNLIEGFKEMIKKMKGLIDTSDIGTGQIGNVDYSVEFFNILPLTSFVSSVVLYLILPPSISLLRLDYSTKVASCLTKIKMISHLGGSIFGITHPASVTGNSYIFYPIVFFIYIIPTVLWFGIYYGCRDISHGILYFICMVSCALMGYIWAYCMGIIVSSCLNMTCKYEEIQNGFWYDFWRLKVEKLRTCCGNKINNYCYCKLPSIIKGLKEGEDQRIFRCSKLTCNDNKNKNLKYSKNGKNGVLICSPNIGKELSSCMQACSKCSNGCCVKIVGVYNLESVTTSSCQDCQLTIRLEGSCSSGNGNCKVCFPGGSCTCNGNVKCCCICTKCCNGGQTCSECCCFKYCNSSCQSCGCTNNNGELGTRVFIAYPNGSDKCCIKEIKPNNVDNFDGDFSRHNEFDIRDIFISDCCHSDIRVDLHCGMKNNMFRLTGMNYPRKSYESMSLVFKYVISKCCKKGEAKCCCTYRELVRACIKYDDSECSAEPVNGPCTGADSSGCAKYCHLNIDQEDSFTKKVDKIRIKLIVICWMIIAIVYFIAIMILMIIKSCNESYNFDGKISYSKIKEPVKKQPYNSVNQLNTRLTPFVGATDMTSLIESKNNEVDNIMEIFKRSMSDKDFSKLSKYIDKKSHSFISSSNKPEIKKLGFTLVVWAHCIGMLYNYVHSHFYKLQKFFLEWEELWETEHCLYRDRMKKMFDKVSRGSISMIVEFRGARICDEKFNDLGLKRQVSWVGVLKDLKNFSKITDNDSNIKDCSLPMKLESRLYCYINLWKDRTEILNKIIEIKIDMFDWNRFMINRSKIKEWVDEMTPYLKLAYEMEVPEGTIES